jgi:hypothetical protein
LADGRTISWPISRRDLKLWLSETYPVILVVYDGQEDRAYWLYVQAYFSDRSTAELFAAGDTINVHIPIRSRINRRSIRIIARHKWNVQQGLRRKEPDDE